MGKTSSRLWSIWAIPALMLSILVIAFVSSKLALPYGILADSFHYGEYFASLASVAAGNSSAPPLVIHGALDYIPGLLARRLFGADSYFFPTWLSYRLLDAVAAILFLLIASRFTKGSSYRVLSLMGVAISAPLLVGYRDVVLLFAVYLYFLRQDRHSQGVYWLIEILLGTAMAFGLYWSFDRGIAGTVALGAAGLICAHQEHRYLPSLIFFGLVAVLLGQLFPELTLGNYVENLRFLIATSSDWSYGWKFVPMTLTALSGIVNISANWLLWASMTESKVPRFQLANTVLLSALSIVLFRVGTNRADEDHILWSLWGPLLIGLYWLPIWKESRQGVYMARASTVALALVVAVDASYRFLTLPASLASTLSLPVALSIAPFLILGVFASFGVRRQGSGTLPLRRLIGAAMLIPFVGQLYLISVARAKGDYAWTDYYRSVPSNSDMVSFGVRWTSQELLNRDASCILDFSNSGVINGLTNLPTCTRFTYLIYADQRYEGEIIEALAQRQPKAIVYSLSDWSYFIDGKSMPSRFPKLNEYLLVNYPLEECAYAYCVRYQEPVNE